MHLATAHITEAPSRSIRSTPNSAPRAAGWLMLAIAPTGLREPKRDSWCHTSTVSNPHPSSPATANYSSAALDVAIAEATRARSTLSDRISALRSRSGILIGASGIAAGLISATSTNPLYALPIAAFLLAAILGVLSIAPGASNANTAATVASRVEGKTAFDMKRWVLEKIASEAAAEEKRMKYPVIFDRIGTWTFVAAIVLVLLTPMLPYTNYSADEPVKITIVEDE
jgi:hypothetical protein